MYSEYFSCCFPDRGKKGSMGHFKEIEIVFINIFFPNRVETRSKNSRKINKVYEISYPSKNSISFCRFSIPIDYDNGCEVTRDYSTCQTKVLDEEGKDCEVLVGVL